MLRRSVVSDALQPARLLGSRGAPRQDTGVGAISFSSGSSRPGTEPESPEAPALADAFFTTEPPAKPETSMSHPELGV